MAVDIVIYHNPECGTSRNTLGLIRNAGIEPHVVEYLKTPPARALPPAPRSAAQRSITAGVASRAGTNDGCVRPATGDACASSGLIRSHISSRP